MRSASSNSGSSSRGKASTSMPKRGFASIKSSALCGAHVCVMPAASGSGPLRAPHCDADVPLCGLVSQHMLNVGNVVLLEIRKETIDHLRG